mgnify:FL=1
MLNNFTHCPICGIKIVSKNNDVFYCGLNAGSTTYHFLSAPEVVEEIICDDYYLVFEPDHVDINFEDDDSKSCMIENVPLTFKELNTKAKCLMMAENYLLME